MLLIANVFASIPLYTENPKHVEREVFFPSRLVFIITSQLRVLKTNRYIPPIKVR